MRMPNKDSHYDRFAEDFSNTRERSWDEFEIIFPEIGQGDKILDLGCGKACSSIFLAKEYDVKVWATDLWIDATTNFENIKAMDAEENVFPIYSI